jgi:hypothetical protein
MQDLILTTEHKRRIFMELKNWEWCRQARWSTGERVELYSMYSGYHIIYVKGMGMETSFRVPSYAGFVQYEKWIEEVQEFLDGNWNEEKYEEMAVFKDNLDVIKDLLNMKVEGEQN